MPRPKRLRRVIRPPMIKGLNSYGERLLKSEPVLLWLEEYEAIRWCDYELKTQAEAAQLMNVSRPTLTRIYESARRKMALVLTEGRDLRVEGGKVVIDGEWSVCPACDSIFNNAGLPEEAGCCPLCGNLKTERYQ